MRHRKITERIIGAATEVHNRLGNNFPEKIYQRALAIEMDYDRLDFEREKETTIFYRDKPIGTRRADFFVEHCVMVEIRAVAQLEEVHAAHLAEYLEAYQMEIGLLINFGAQRLQFIRVHNDKLIQQLSLAAY